MLDQSFSAENFRKIFDRENRKGANLEKFFPEVSKITREIKNISYEIKKTQDKNEIKPLHEKKDKLKIEKEFFLMKELKGISSKVSEKKFSFEIKEKDIKGKLIYFISNSPCAYFAMKQLQRNFEKTYKIKQSNRDEIISQIKEILSDEFPKIALKTDIKSFYESIPQKTIIEKIDSDYLLSRKSIFLIKNIFFEYNKLSGNENKIGIPRGIGISAYLSEMYMRSIDRQIKSKEDVLYYSRYVDDILIVETSKPNCNEEEKIYEETKKIIEKCSLSMHELDDKKTKIMHFGKEKNNSFEYLGYQLSSSSGKICIQLSSNKIEKYKKRIALSFNSYESYKNRNPKDSKSILLNRIRFLTGNTRLKNDKKHVLVGIYFSNKYVNKIKKIKSIDHFLKREIEKIEDKKLKKKLNSLSFEKGFNNKIFYNFSLSDIQGITKVWKNA